MPFLGFQPSTSRKRSITTADKKQCKTVYPSIIGIDGHHFDLGIERGVSQDATDEFYTLWASGMNIKLEHIPAYLMQYKNHSYIPERD